MTDKTREERADYAAGYRAGFKAGEKKVFLRSSHSQVKCIICGSWVKFCHECGVPFPRTQETAASEKGE